MLRAARCVAVPSAQIGGESRRRTYLAVQISKGAFCLGRRSLRLIAYEFDLDSSPQLLLVDECLSRGVIAACSAKPCLQLLDAAPEFDALSSWTPNTTSTTCRSLSFFMCALSNKRFLSSRRSFGMKHSHCNSRKLRGSVPDSGCVGASFSSTPSRPQYESSRLDRLAGSPAA